MSWSHNPPTAPPMFSNQPAPFPSSQPAGFGQPSATLGGAPRPFGSAPAMGAPSLGMPRTGMGMGRPMGMPMGGGGIGGGGEDTSKATNISLIYLAVLFMCETTAFGMLMTLNSFSLDSTPTFHDLKLDFRTMHSSAFVSDLWVERKDEMCYTLSSDLSRKVYDFFPTQESRFPFSHIVYYTIVRNGRDAILARWVKLLSQECTCSLQSLDSRRLNPHSFSRCVALAKMSLTA